MLAWKDVVSNYMFGFKECPKRPMKTYLRTV